MTAAMNADMTTLTVVPDGDAWVIGNPRTRCYVAVPEIGALIIGWLQAGDDPSVVARRAEQLAGDVVDIDDFLDTLLAEGVLTTSRTPDTAAAVSPILQRTGRIVFSRAGWFAQLAFGVASAAAVIHDPGLLPQSQDVIVAGSPVASILIASLTTVICTAFHEAGHVLAAAARGVPSSLSISRRLYFVTAQADLTALWGLPRRQRIPPLLAGLSVDVSITGLMILAQTFRLPDSIASTLAAAVVVQFFAIILQSAIFMRTDLYAVFATLSGSRNLWALKSAVLRQAIGRTTTADAEVISASSRRDRGWASAYLALYVPGLGMSLVYLVAVTVPALRHLVELIVQGLSPFHLSSARTWQSLAALAFVLAPSGAALVAAAVSGATSVTRALLDAERPTKAGGGTGAPDSRR